MIHTADEERDFTVAELIEALSKMPPDVFVGTAHDTCAGGTINCVWLSNNGIVNIGSEHELLIDEDDHPVGYRSSVSPDYHSVGEMIAIIATNERGEGME